MADEAPDADAPITVERLTPPEAAALPDAIQATYGDSYDHAWAYDVDAVAARLADETLVSFVGRASTPGASRATVVGHAGLLRDTTVDPVGESGLAVVDPAWRSHHLFPTLKRALADWCGTEGMFGMYSEVTAAHPYSEKANLHLGARSGVPARLHPGGRDVRGDRRGRRLAPSQRRGVLARDESGAHRASSTRRRGTHRSSAASTSTSSCRARS